MWYPPLLADRGPGELGEELFLLQNHLSCWWQELSALGQRSSRVTIRTEKIGEAWDKEAKSRASRCNPASGLAKAMPWTWELGKMKIDKVR